MKTERPRTQAARPAFYALPTGGWRDYWTLLHPPYTAWHLSYVAIGAAVAPHLDGGRLAASLLGFFLGWPPWRLWPPWGWASSVR